MDSNKKVDEVVGYFTTPIIFLYMNIVENKLNFKIYIGKVL